MAKLDAHDIIRTIAESKKKTPVKVYIKGKVEELTIPDGVEAYLEKKTGVLFGDWKEVAPLLEDTSKITAYHIENDGRNTGVPLLDKKKFNARIEPGAVIREQVEIGDNAVIMMGAVINIGAEIGANSMIDMGAILGGRAIVGENCHIGAGTVLAGVVEPPSAQPVVVEDGVLIGANAVVLEGVRIGKGAVVGAGSVVTKDVAPNTVVVGLPAKKIKNVSDVAAGKTDLVDELRKI
ncbi:2,3,4,5-tetrahydropyridine-2,6-dicarboxylate N-acetyltransferase [Liquorilactobacillus sucicola DSM 21376 = JCM 15457]|uniref:2,3,4,5-tetrahydropyridine-2,6-dicarboxylate N-acetyltransferase n=1 Tax=Liquorilactobacillus sucicola DSM 21376 = JCM 15457 TaxID=1423806 RepID=A0A023D0Z1_9LACO|nr:2,3,4,5-tetrahydropyridine-2,6-dicarboxylate N-acetyltransferase [Liquorilactobacillus sucicola]KRN06429.1 2,3,4,5-tetrahydropyridine-2-carboxylate N-succinyltransferase [Liquorilactobacillus sucicola DSM 21376 = JCM 15457]GAJ27440.1 2,3,4,5-tetrahydropyridine-2,6-dicarboxylate N-acetyltransferase [Liquorilactobacillus sucicola DSM 21376 = JCM 15457]